MKTLYVKFGLMMNLRKKIPSKLQKALMKILKIFSLKNLSKYQQI